MEKSEEFYTLKGYQLNESLILTTAMEDYLEMIFRISQKNKQVHVNELAKSLNVKPSSTSKMVHQLCLLGYVKAEKYGIITLTDKGLLTGSYLIYRHNVINNFLCVLKSTENELEETEKIEHFLNNDTIECLDKLTKKLILDKNN